jgi:hypothetical protein
MGVRVSSEVRIVERAQVMIRIPVSPVRTNR